MWGSLLPTGVAGALPWHTGPQGERPGLSQSPLRPECSTTVSAPKQPPRAGGGLPSQSRPTALTFSSFVSPGVSLQKSIATPPSCGSQKKWGAGFLRNPDRFFPSPHPFSSESLLGFLLFHTVWWEFLQLHTFRLFEAFPSVFIATQEATQWLKTTNMCLFVHVSVGQLDSV